MFIFSSGPPAQECFTYLWRWVCFSIAIAVSLPLQAKPGDLDLTFGSGTGKVLVTIGNSIDHQSASVLQPDGKLLVRGYCQPSQVDVRQIACVARFMPDGRLDANFGNEGVFIHQGVCRGSGGIARSPSGEILLSGTIRTSASGFTRDELCISRLRNDGTLDVSFGTQGISTADIATATGMSGNSEVVALASGRILVIGNCIQPMRPSQIVIELKFCASRFFSDGKLDTAFGSGGSVTVINASASDQLVTAAYDGQYVYVAGACSPQNGGNFRMCVTKMDDAGNVATNWAVDGVFQLSQQNYSLGANALRVDVSGALIVVGSRLDAAGSSGAPTRQGCLAMVSSNGAPQPGFGVGGLICGLSSHSLSGFGSVVRGADGRIVIGGRCGESSLSNSPCIWSVKSDGAVDSGFGDAGVKVVSFAPTVQTALRNGLHEQANGKLLFAMSCVHSNGDEDFCLARLLGNTGYFDLDSDNATASNSDALLYLRHLLGFHDTALTSGALGTYADRTSATDIATYLSTPNANFPNCSVSIVGAPGGPQAMLDGIVLLRAMMGLTGDAVTNSIAFPAGTARTSWVDIKAHLNGNCGMALN